MFDLHNIDNLYVGDWVCNTDEETNYTYVRCLKPEEAYEVLHVRHDYDEAEFVHTVIFLDEYTLEQLDDIVHGFGCDDMRSLMEDSNDDYFMLVAMIAESMTGRTMSCQQAIELTDVIIGKETA